jgi:hypothetical protein
LVRAGSSDALVTRAEYRVARELVLGLEEDLLPKDARYWELTGHPPALSFREAAARALASEPRGSSSARIFESFVRQLGPRDSTTVGR